MDIPGRPALVWGWNRTGVNLGEREGGGEMRKSGGRANWAWDIMYERRKKAKTSPPTHTHTHGVDISS